MKGCIMTICGNPFHNSIRYFLLLEMAGQEGSDFCSTWLGRRHEYLVSVKTGWLGCGEWLERTGRVSDETECLAKTKLGSTKLSRKRRVLNPEISVITSWVCFLEEGKTLLCVYEHLR